MERSRGVSLIEILIALFISTTVLVFLCQEGLHRAHWFGRVFSAHLTYEEQGNRREVRWIKRIQGFYTLELMIALLLSFVILAGLNQYYGIGRYQHQELYKQIDISFDLVMVEQLLRQSIRRAGFTPCLPLDSLVTDDGQGRTLRTYQIDPSGTSLTLSGMDNTIFAVQSTHKAQIQVNERFKAGHTYLIADCYRAELIHPIQFESSFWILKAPLKFKYVPPVYVGLWLKEQFAMTKRPRARLMYVHDHPEELTLYVRELAVKAQAFTGGTALLVNLILQSGKRIPIHTAIRSA